MASPYVFFSGASLPSNGTLLNGAAPGSASSVTVPVWQNVIFNVKAVVAASSGTGYVNNPAYDEIYIKIFSTPFTVTNTSVIPYCSPDYVVPFPITQPMANNTYYRNFTIPGFAGVNAWVWAESQSGLAVTLTIEATEQSVATTAWA